MVSEQELPKNQFGSATTAYNGVTLRQPVYGCKNGHKTTWRVLFTEPRRVAVNAGVIRCSAWEAKRIDE